MLHKHPLRAAVFALLLTACSAMPVSGDSGAQAVAPPTPETAAQPRQAMVAAANPYAVDAALTILRQGGNAVDASIAAEMVLGLVEPQSSGVGGGGFMMHYDGETRAIVAYDGRERAPMTATENLFMRRGQPMSFPDAAASGLGVGTPSLVAMLKMAHDEHGALPWEDLFQPAITLAENGFAISPRLEGFLTNAFFSERLKADIAARSYFYDTQGNAWPVGYVLRNPTYARTLRAIAEQGPDALTRGPIADAIIRSVHAQPRPGSLSLSDLQNYQPRRLEPLCGHFRVYRVCGMPSPSSGGEAVAAVLGLYERAMPQAGRADSVDAWAAFLWASRLAYVDRDHYVGDDEFLPVPQQEMIAPSYLDQRAQLIDLSHAPQGLSPGAPAGEELLMRWGRDRTNEQPGTTHMSIVDGDGNAVSMTATVQAPFGAMRMAGGFLLNNQLTDFSFAPTMDGLPVANAPGPGKRPRSSMAPTIVTDDNGQLVMAVGSPGGSSIIAYVSRTIIGVLDWGQSPQDAAATGNAVARTPPARMESAQIPAGVVDGLRARGWAIADSSGEVSGIHVVEVTPEGLIGGADPRREGRAVALELPAGE